MATYTWQKQDLSSGKITFSPGARYAILASVDTSNSLTEIRQYVQKHGFSVTYICELAAGSPDACDKRQQYQVDQWLASISAPPRSGERWVYAEGDYGGAEPWTVSATYSFPLVTHYSVADEFLAVPAESVPSAPTLPAEPVVTPPAQPSSLGWVAALGVVGAAGALLWWWRTT